jgi:hypothetical protein
MKKISKYGLSALCGSLAAVSAAQAGTMTVTGNAHLTYTEVGNAVTGQPLGMKTNLSFVGDGELDGGQTFSVTIAHNDQATWSSANITLNTNSLGSWKLSSAEGGNGIGGYDDNMPRAVEEVWDAGAGTNVNLQKGVGSSTSLQWESPRIGATTLRVAWAPENDGTQPTDKSTGGITNADRERGIDALIRINPSFGAFGADLFVGYSETTLGNNAKAFDKDTENRDREAVGGLTIDLGPLSIGGQVSAEYMPTRALNTTEYYGNASFGASFNVNDNLSFSYGEMRSLKGNTKKAQKTNTVAVSQGGPEAARSSNMDLTPKTEMTGESWQIAYTIGGVAFKYADTEITNPKYAKNTKSDAQLFIMSMAF